MKEELQTVKFQKRKVMVMRTLKDDERVRKRDEDHQSVLFVVVVDDDDEGYRQW